MADALRASVNVAGSGLAEVGWHPTDEWRTALVELSRRAAVRR